MVGQVPKNDVIEDFWLKQEDYPPITPITQRSRGRNQQHAGSVGA